MPWLHLSSHLKHVEIFANLKMSFFGPRIYRYNYMPRVVGNCFISFLTERFLTCFCCCGCNLNDNLYQQVWQIFDISTVRLIDLRFTWPSRMTYTWARFIVTVSICTGVEVEPDFWVFRFAVWNIDTILIYLQYHVNYTLNCYLERFLIFDVKFQHFEKLFLLFSHKFVWDL